MNTNRFIQPTKIRFFPQKVLPQCEWGFFCKLGVERNGMKKLIYIFFLFLLLAGCTDDLTSLYGGAKPIKVDDNQLQSSYWTVCGMVAPQDYQELNRFTYRPDDDKYLVSEVSFEGDKMRIIFPSGGYRDLTYTLSEDKLSISFDAPLIYGYHDAPNVISCKVSSEKINLGDVLSYLGFGKIKMEDSHFLTFYEADNLSNVNMDKGEWRLNLIQGEPAQKRTPLHRLDCEYGTSVSPIKVIEGEPAWAYYFAANGATFPKITGYDLATVHYGPGWRLPTRAEAEKLLSSSTSGKMNLIIDGVTYHGVGLNFEESGKFLFLEVGDEPGESGFWLSDGSAVVYSYDEHNHTEIGISDETDGKNFRVRPVRP